MRNWINLLNELSISDFGGGDGDGDGHSQTVLVTNIDWDTDGEDVDLPTQVTIGVYGDDDEQIRDNIADALSDRYGWCVNDFNYRFI